MRQDRKSRVPRITSTPPDVTGSLSKETIRRVINRQLNQVRHCYEQQLTARPDLAGRVAIRFVIDPTGQVPAAVVASSSLGHMPTEQCIAGVMRRLVFPAPDGGGLVKVTYPFVLAQAGG
jgi:outer membrane biosynthesis protein TonB